MVTFTCSGCNESLRKGKVEHHMNTCRRWEYMTCIDCSKDFYHDSYQDHTSCITENQKYGAVGEVHKENKGDLKQQEWTNCVRDAINKKNLTPKVAEILKKLEKFDNIPRKKGKFINFLGNSFRIYNNQLATQVYDAIPQPQNKPPPPKTPTKVETLLSNGQKKKEEPVENNNNEKRVIKQESNEIRKEYTENGKAFSWNKAIKRVLVDAPENELPFKKLRRKVLKDYKKSVLVVRLDKPALKDKFADRVEKCKKFTKVGDIVQLSRKSTEILT